MSIERDLLHRWYRGARDQVDFGELYDKTEELLAQPEQTAVDNAVYTVSWHEKKHRDDNWEVRRHIVSNPELIKMFLTFNKQLSELIFGKNIIWGLQMQEGEPTKEYDLKLCKTKEVIDQPEQTEQEPVAWITEWVQRYRHNDTPIIDRAVSFTKGDAPAVPNPNYIPLYTSPPKREPLSDDEIVALWANKSPANEFECVRLVEKAHGIGGGNE